MDMSDMRSLWDARYEAKGALWGAVPDGNFRFLFVETKGSRTGRPP